MITPLQRMRKNEHMAGPERLDPPSSALTLMPAGAVVVTIASVAVIVVTGWLLDCLQIKKIENGPHPSGDGHRPRLIEGERLSTAISASDMRTGGHKDRRTGGQEDRAITLIYIRVTTDDLSDAMNATAKARKNGTL